MLANGLSASLKLPIAKVLENGSISFRWRMSTMRPKWLRQSAPKIGFGASGIWNCHDNERFRLKFSSKSLVPYVLMIESLAAMSWKALGWAVGLRLGSKDILAPVSTRKTRFELTSRTWKRLDRLGSPLEASSRAGVTCFPNETRPMSSYRGKTSPSHQTWCANSRVCLASESLLLGRFFGSDYYFAIWSNRDLASCHCC